MLPSLALVSAPPPVSTLCLLLSMAFFSLSPLFLLFFRSLVFLSLALASCALEFSFSALQRVAVYPTRMKETGEESSEHVPIVSLFFPPGLTTMVVPKLQTCRFFAPSFSHIFLTISVFQHTGLFRL